MIDCLPNPIAWTIGLNGRVAEFFSDDLNMFGIYLTQDSQFLIINNTAVNNNTLIRCGATSLTVTRQTRLIVYSKYKMIDSIIMDFSQILMIIITCYYIHLTQ